MHIYLVRHGQKRTDQTRFREGQFDPDLSEVGKHQSNCTGERLSSSSLQAIYCSDLVRTQQTASIINLHLHLPLRLRPELREIFMGDWEGKSFEDLAAEKDKYYLSWAQHTFDMPYPNGESGANVLQRMMTLLSEIEQQKLESVLLVTHGGVIRVLVSACIQLHMKFRFNLPVSNCGLTHLVKSSHHSGYKLLSMNDTVHLSDIP